MDALVASGAGFAYSDSFWVLTPFQSEFLLSWGDKQTLLRFGTDSTRQGLNSALQKYYSLQDAAQLSQAWRHWVRKRVATTEFLSLRLPAVLSEREMLMAS
jgi:hypothetical protein